MTGWPQPTSTRQPRPEPLDAGERHHHRPAGAKTHDLGVDAAAGAALDPAAIADGEAAGEPLDLDEQADDGADPAVDAVLRQPVDLVDGRRWWRRTRRRLRTVRRLKAPPLCLGAG